MRKLKPWVRHMRNVLIFTLLFTISLLALVWGLERNFNVQEERVESWEEQFEEVSR